MNFLIHCWVGGSRGGPAHFPEDYVILQNHDIIHTIFEQKIYSQTRYRKSQMMAIKWKAKWPRFEMLLSSFLLNFFAENSHEWYLGIMKWHLLLVWRRVLPCHPSHLTMNKKSQENLVFSKIGEFEYLLWLQIGFIHSKSLFQVLVS